MVDFLADLLADFLIDLRGRGALRRFRSFFAPDFFASPEVDFGADFAFLGISTPLA